MSSPSDLVGSILGMGNPLLDISADVEQDFLDKYGVSLNNAILAEEKHLPMYEDMEKQFSNVTYTAGGATQNSIRVAQWMLQVPGATSYFGAVGTDEHGAHLKEEASKDGVHVAYYETSEFPTGTCACLIKDCERSLIANLGAANHYQPEHLEREDVKPIWEKAKIIYVGGFFLTVSPDAIMVLAKHCSANADKLFAMNLSAPFIPQFFKDPLAAAMPYIDLLFGNESEAEAYAKTNDFGDGVDVKEIAQRIAALPKEDKARPRVVVITQGSKHTIVATADEVTVYDVPAMDKSEIVDSNGAGDSFVGGYLAMAAKGASQAVCVDAGHYAAQMILKVSGIVLSGKPSFEPSS